MEKARSKYSAVVGEEEVLNPFLTWAQLQSDRVTLKAPAPDTALKPGSDVTLSAGVKAGSVGIRSVRFYAGSKLVGTATKAPYDVVWHKVPRTLAQIRVPATDTTRATIQSTPVNLTIGAADNALFVVEQHERADPGRAAHRAEAQLPRPGVHPEQAASDVAAGDTTGKALILVSPNVTPADLKVKLATTAVPMVVEKADLYADLGMATASGPAYGAQKATFTASVLSGGLTGSVDIYHQPDIASYGTGLGSKAIVAATMPSTAARPWCSATTTHAGDRRAPRRPPGRGVPRRLRAAAHPDHTGHQEGLRHGRHLGDRSLTPLMTLAGSLAPGQHPISG